MQEQRIKESQREAKPLLITNSPSPWQGEGDKGDRVIKNKEYGAENNLEELCLIKAGREVLEMSISLSGSELINIAIGIERRGIAFYDVMVRSANQRRLSF